LQRVIREIMEATPELREDMRRMALYGAWLIVLFTLLLLASVAVSPAGGLPYWHWIPLTIFALGLIAVLRRPPPPFYLSLTGWALLFSGHELVIWIDYDDWARFGHPFMPFNGQRMVMMVVAFLAPTLSVGATAICAAALTATAQYLSWSPTTRQLVPVIEPWFTIVFAAAMLGVLRSQLRAVASARAALHARAQQAFSERIARLALSVRAYTNTPLQTVTFALGVLRLQEGTHERTLENIAEISVRLTRLNRALEPLARHINWTGEPISFDALDRIASELGDRAPRVTAAPAIEIVPPAREARRALLISSAVWAFAGALRGLTLEPGTARSAWLVIAASMLVCGAVTLALPRLPRLASLTLLAIQTLAIVAGTLLSTAALAASGRPFAPLAGIKLLLLAIPFLVPSGPLGAALIAASTAATVAQLSMWPIEWRSRIFTAEPGITITTAFGAFLILVVRRRSIAQLEAAARAQAEAAWFARLARLALLVRELSETTVEELRTATAQLKTLSADEQRTAKRMDHAVTRLAKLSEVLAEIAPSGPTHPTPRAFTEALSQVEQEVLDLAAQAPRA
jgi:hypothetical protein